MRLTKSDRRTLDLLLRNRLAPVHKITLSSSLLVALTVSIWLSPEAYAKIQDETAQLKLEKTFALEQEDDTIREYSREELSRDTPKAHGTIGDAFGDQLIGVIKSVGASSRSAGKIQKHRSNEQTTGDYFNFAAVGSNPNEHNSEADPEAIRKQINKESANAVARESFEKTAFWQKIKQGLDFKLDFAAMFGKKKEEEPTSSKGKVRYGLIIKKIEPDNDIEKSRAAVDSTLMDDEMAYAGKAEVEWTIGPITEEPNRKKRVFEAKRTLPNGAVMGEEDLEALRDYQEALDEEQDPDDPTYVAKEAETDANVWKQGIKPSFGGNLKPSGKNAGADVTEQKAPGLEITFTQEQGLYEYMTRTAGGTSKQYSEHRFKLPIIGTFAVGRRYNDKMEVISTSAHNILLTKRLPSVSVHYYEQTEQVVTQASHEADGLTLTAGARTDAKKVGKNAKQKRKNQEGYEVGLGKRF